MELVGHGRLHFGGLQRQGPSQVFRHMSALLAGGSATMGQDISCCHPLITTWPTGSAC